MHQSPSLPCLLLLSDLLLCSLLPPPSAADVYTSTKDALQALYDKVSPGGLIYLVSCCVALNWLVSLCGPAVIVVV